MGDRHIFRGHIFRGKRPRTVVSSPTYPEAASVTIDRRKFVSLLAGTAVFSACGQSQRQTKILGIPEDEACTGIPYGKKNDYDQLLEQSVGGIHVPRHPYEAFIFLPTTGYTTVLMTGGSRVAFRLYILVNRRRLKRRITNNADQLLAAVKSVLKTNFKAGDLQDEKQESRAVQLVESELRRLLEWEGFLETYLVIECEIEYPPSQDALFGIE